MFQMSFFLKQQQLLMQNKYEEEFTISKLKKIHPDGGGCLIIIYLITIVNELQLEDG